MARWRMASVGAVWSLAVLSVAWVASDVTVAWADSLDARRALAQSIHEVNVEGQSLSRVIDFLRDTSGTNIVVNWKVLETVGVAKETSISLQVRDLTLSKMLRLVLDQASPNAQLVYNVDANVIQITTQEDADKQMITKVYIVDDLVMVNNQTVQAPQLNLQAATGSQSSGGGSNGGGGGGGGGGSGGGQSLFTQTTSASSTTPQQNSAAKGMELVDLIREVIRPSIWKENGGPAAIRYFAGKLIVTAPLSVHEAIGGRVNDGSSIRFGM